MLKPRFLLVLLALSMVGAVGFVWNRHKSATADALFARATDRLSSEEPDYDAALRELDLALDLALAQDQKELAGEIFLTRGRTYQRRRALSKAREDFAHVLGEYMPGSVTVALQIGWIDYSSENYADALATATAILNELPTHSGALHLRGRALFRLAETTVGECKEKLDERLADEPAAVGTALAWKVAALDPGTPRRAAALSELIALVDDEELALALQAQLEAATVAIVEARRSFAESLQSFPTADSIVGFLELLQRAERPEEAVDLGLAALVHPRFQESPAGIAIVVDALEELDRPRVAAAVIEQARNAGAQETVLAEASAEEEEEDKDNVARKVPTEFLLPWCELLYELEDWRRLEKVARILAKVGGTAAQPALHRPAARLYEGIAKLKLGRYEEAIARLKEYTSSPGPRSPFPGALQYANYALSQAYRAQGRAQDEFRALERATSRLGAPGAAWARLSELQLSQRLPLNTVVHSLTHALRLDPDRAGQLFPLWDRFGTQAYDEQGKRLTQVRRQLRQDGLFVPEERFTMSWEVWSLGHLHLENGQPWGAVVAGQALLKRYPDLFLGWDLVIEGYLARGDHARAVEALVTRNTVVGAHPDSLRILAAVPPEIIRPDQLLILMEQDPRNTGIMTMARALLEDGQADLALAGLTATGIDDLQEEALILVAELQTAVSAWRDVLTTLKPIAIESPNFSRAFALRVRAALEVGKGNVPAWTLEPVIQQLETATIEDPEAMREASLMLIYHGQPELALRLLQRIDEDGRARTGAVLDALAAANLVGGHGAEAEEALDRAEAFLADGSPDVGRIALYATLERWSEIPGAVDDLRKSEFVPSDLADAILLALEERVEEALSAAVEALEEAPDDPRWFVVHAAANALLPEAERREAAVEDPFGPQTLLFAGAVPEGYDPRQALVALLATDSLTWSTWAIAHLDELDPRRVGVLWPVWLRIGALRHHDEVDKRRSLLSSFVQARPQFAWAWQLLEELELARVGTEFAPSYQKLVEERLTALGPAPDTPSLNAAVRAQRMLRLERVDEAVNLLTDSLDTDGEDPLVLLTLARIRAALGARREAIGLWARVFDALPPEEVASLVPEFLALCEAAYTEGMITRPMWKVELEALAVEHPNDPAIALATAQMHVLSLRDSAAGLAQGLAELDVFREKTGWVPVDGLRSGSAEDWFDFYLEHNASEAEDFVRGELLGRPGSAALWRMLARAIEQQGKKKDAFDRYFALINILPDTEALRRAGEILADRGSDHPLVEATIAKVQAIEGAPPNEPSLIFLRGRSLANSGDPEALDQGVGQLRVLWMQRAALHGQVDAPLVGFRYGASLLHRSNPEDGPVAGQVLAEVLPVVRDPVQRDLTLALAHLARWVPQDTAPADGEGL